MSDLVTRAKVLEAQAEELAAPDHRGFSLISSNILADLAKLVRELAEAAERQGTGDRDE